MSSENAAMMSGSASNASAFGARYARRLASGRGRRRLAAAGVAGGSRLQEMTKHPPSHSLRRGRRMTNAEGMTKKEARESHE